MRLANILQTPSERRQRRLQELLLRHDGARHDLLSVIMRAADVGGIEDLRLQYGWGSGANGETELPNRQHLLVSTNVIGGRDSFFERVSGGRVDVTLADPYGAEEVHVINTVTIDAESYPYTNATGDRPGVIWRHHDSMESLEANLGDQFTTALTDPERFYGAYALQLFQTGQALAVRA